MGLGRRSEYDVTDRVDTTNPDAVRAEVLRLHAALYPRPCDPAIERAFEDCARLYHGTYPGYRACDTAYHNLQHTLDVALAMARLMDGYEQASDGVHRLGPRLFSFGIVTALFHDIGYLRRNSDSRHRNGAEYTLSHVSRGARFLEPYMGELGMPELAAAAASVIHFTGYEMDVSDIQVPGEVFRRIGHMLGTADIIAQMSDRCYLEKCRDRLYPEFVCGGLAATPGHPLSGAARFVSAEDLLLKTPAFYLVAEHRLTALLGSAFQYARTHFGGDDPYHAELQKNIDHARRVAEQGGVSRLLRRNPPPRSAATGSSAANRQVPASGPERSRIEATA